CGLQSSLFSAAAAYISYEVKACLVPDVFCSHAAKRRGFEVGRNGGYGHVQQGERRDTEAVRKRRSDMEIRGQMGASTGPYKGLWFGLGWITGEKPWRMKRRESGEWATEKKEHGFFRIDRNGDSNRDVDGILVFLLNDL
ncbi:hypothetical protein KUCAC02_033692, partial [Chaenocephalus aceratus]